MLSQASGRWAQATALAGEPIETGIWIRTQPRPWYARYVGVGALSEFLLVAGSAVFAWAFRTLSPQPWNDTERQLDHSGSVLCAQSASQIVFLESLESIRGRKLTRVLRTYPRQALRHCEYHLGDMSLVTLEFTSGDCLQLHYVGGERDLLRFVSTLQTSAQRPDC